MRDSTRRRAAGVYANRSASLHFINISPAQKYRGGTVQESTCVLYGARARYKVCMRAPESDENNNCVIDRPCTRRLPESCTAVCKCTILYLRRFIRASVRFPRNIIVRETRGVFLCSANGTRMCGEAAQDQARSCRFSRQDSLELSGR